ncbi:MAG: aminopeptidase [Herbinix sp.]|nr:aminopeptidase [Herbinix sp.]
MDILKTITELTRTPGVSGNECAVADILERNFRKYTSDVWRDPMGNVYGRIGSGKPVVMLMAHMDEIGMAVTEIEKNGMLRMCQVGGVDPRVLPGSEVVVYGKEILKGVVGTVPPHLLKESDRNSAYDLYNLTCDVGLPYEKVIELVSVGDFITFDNLPPLELKNGFIAGKTFDDRAMAAALVEVLDILSKRKLNCTVVCVGSVQEELGCLGAGVASYNLKPDLAIATDVCHAPTPGADPQRVLDPSKVAVTTGGNIHPGVHRMITEAAKELNIPYGVEVAIARTGTDAWNIQTQCGGIAVGLISLPLRYMHTNVETISLNTLHNCAKLLAEVPASIGEDWEEKLCWND